MTRTAIEIRDVSFAHASEIPPALNGVSLNVQPGEAVALLGASGAGKTTLLTLLDGRLRDWTGSALVLGRPLHPDRMPPKKARADSGFIFQEFALVERSPVLRNVLNGRLGRMPGLTAFLGRHGARDIGIARRALADCGIAELADRRVDSLSGGQRQRVAIARCLAQEPQLILADEPVSSLDPTRAAEILELITGAARDRGATVIFSSHQPELAARFANRIVGMTKGRIAFDRPASDLPEHDIAALYRDEVAQADAGPALRVVR